jgi:hypothetical protein
LELSLLLHGDSFLFGDVVWKDEVLVVVWHSFKFEVLWVDVILNIKHGPVDGRSVSSTVAEQEKTVWVLAQDFIMGQISDEILMVVAM